MQSLEASYEEGEVTPSLCDCSFKMVCTHNRSFKKAKLSTQRSSLSVLDNVPTYNDSPHASAGSTTPQKPQFCIHTKLLHLYLEECAKDPNQLRTGLKRNTHLLEKLVARERLNTIILNLYPGNKGYSITFPMHPLSDSCTDDTAETMETKPWPYEDAELLRYLDLEELPAFLVDLFEPAYGFLFYSGCIIAKVRDYRQAFPAHKATIHHVLLRPTLQSILADVQKLAEEKSAEERAQLESRILLAHHPTLCLDSKSTTVAERTAHLQHNRHLFVTNRIRRAAMKYSQVTINRKKKLMSHTQRPGLELYEYMNRLRARSRTGAPSTVRLPRREELKPIPAPCLDSPSIAMPSQGVDIAEFKAYPPTRETRESVDDAGFPQYMENCQPQLVEEYVLETNMHSKEPDKRRVYQMKLSILQRPLNGEYLGELYLDRDHKKGERNGVASRFSLGTRVQANRYIQQFTEIFTESGRKSVRVNYCFAQNHPQVQTPQQAAGGVQHPVQPSAPTLQPSVAVSYQPLPGTGANSVVNGTTVNLLPTHQTASASVPILQAQLQTNKQTQDANSELAFNVLSTKLMNSVQQIQAANAKQTTQKSTCSNAAIINLLNRSPASNINSDANAAVVNAINNSQLLSQQQGTKFVGRKITVANMSTNARVLNAANVISVNNNRSLGDTSGLQPQQITLSTVSGSNFFTTVTVSKQQTRAHNDGGKAALSALLVGTAAADQPDIASTNTNSLLLEKLAGISSGSSKHPTSPTFIQSPKQYAVQSPKMSPLASPPPQTQTINVQGLNYTTIQGLQGVQVQLPGFSQPMRAFLNVASTGGLQGQSLVVTVPVTTTANSAAGAGVTQCVNNNNSNVANAISVSNVTGTPTVVLGNAGTSNLAQLVATGVNVKRAGVQGTVLAANSTPLQLVTPIQRPRQLQQGQRLQFQQQVQRQMPITIKMAATGGAVSAQSANVTQNVVQQVQKQFQHQQVQLQLTNQQQFHQATASQPQHIHLNKIARRSSQNVSDPP
ncbi:uncharacterized protein Spt20 isoform X2 [Atheta coriaria]|uniref:uncharacterized protein Spt20 isoform X2 n=1 Tax=Dalotia coriaria TaxID=877792 RepID=UPI0031F33930